MRRSLLGALLSGFLGALVRPAGAAPAAAAPPGAGRAEGQPAVEIVSEIRVHGNVTVPDEEVVRLAGVAVGDRLDPDGLAAIEARLRASGKFDTVEVRKRYRSLDMTAVALVLLVHERAVPAGAPVVVRPWLRLARQSMFLPILGYEEGYGFTYGGRVTVVDGLGLGERVSVPLTWGGEKQAAVEVDRTFGGGPVARLFGRARVSVRRHPHYHVDERRAELGARVEQVVATRVRTGVEVGRASVRFGPAERGHWTIGVDATLDTRGDPAFPGHAVVLEAGWRSLRLDGARAPVTQVRAEARGYLRVVGQSVLAVRARFDGADRALPPYEQWLLGGAGTLRGHRVGELVGDRRAASSVELRIPVDSPVGTGRAGFVVFYDAGKVWAAGEPFRAVRWRQGAGVGVFVLAPFFRLGLDVAANLDGGGGRAHLAFGLRF